MQLTTVTSSFNSITISKEEFQRRILTALQAVCSDTFYVYKETHPGICHVIICSQSDKSMHMQCWCSGPDSSVIHVNTKLLFVTLLCMLIRTETKLSFVTLLCVRDCFQLPLQSYSVFKHYVILYELDSVLKSEKV